MLQRFIAIVLLSLGVTGVAHAQDPTPRMQQIIQSYVTDKTFMGTVLVSRDGTLLINQGYGFADVEWNIPNVPEGKFRLGSLTKQFTAASILLLEEQGKLKVEDPVSKYVPDAPPAWEKITIFNLLTHSSGIPNFTSFPDYRTTEGKDTTPQELVARFRDKPLDFPPGTKFSYSNSGYILLGYILEKVSGQTYADFLQKNLFAPLGMSDTGVDSNTAILPKRVPGIRTFRPGHAACRLREHDDSLLSRCTLFNHRRPAQVGARTLWREGAQSRFAQENDDPF